MRNCDAGVVEANPATTVSMFQRRGGGGCVFDDEDGREIAALLALPEPVPIEQAPRLVPVPPSQAVLVRTQQALRRATPCAVVEPRKRCRAVADQGIAPGQAGVEKPAVLAAAKCHAQRGGCRR